MDPFATSHFSNDGLRHDLKACVARDHAGTAVLLTRIAEYDRRKLFLEDGYPSMHAYCIRELHYSEGETYRRIHAARTIRKFPGALVALSDGRLHLRAVLMLARHLRPWNADELVAAATHKSKEEIQLMLAQRFPRRDLPERLEAIPAPAPLVARPTPEAGSELPPEQALAIMPEKAAHGDAARSFQPEAQLTPEQAAGPERMMPLAPEKFGLECTLDRETNDLLREALELMSHQNPTGKIAPVLNRALRLLVDHLKQRKCAATDRPGRACRATSPRHIPAAVKRAVWERDGGQCTFVSESGKRCPSRRLIEIDHQDPVACGGEATVENVRLLCRMHNQYMADRSFGPEFMDHKRADGRAQAAAGRTRRAAERDGVGCAV